MLAEFLLNGDIFAGRFEMLKSVVTERLCQAVPGWPNRRCKYCDKGVIHQRVQEVGGGGLLQPTNRRH